MKRTKLRAVTALLIASLLSGCEVETKETRPIIEEEYEGSIKDYFLNNQNDLDDFKQGNIETVTSDLIDNFLYNLNIYESEYKTDNRVENQFREFRNLKYLNNTQMRIVIKKLIENYEDDLRKDLSSEEATVFIYNQTKEFGTDFCISTKKDDLISMYLLMSFEDEKGKKFTNYYGSETSLLNSSRSILYNEKGNNDYIVMDDYSLQQKDDSLRIIVSKNKNFNSIYIYNGIDYISAEVTQEQANHIIDTMKKNVESKKDIKQYLKDNKSYFKQLFNEDFESILKNVNNEKVLNFKQ